MSSGLLGKRVTVLLVACQWSSASRTAKWVKTISLPRAGFTEEMSHSRDENNNYRLRALPLTASISQYSFFFLFFVGGFNVPEESGVVALVHRWVICRIRFLRGSRLASPPPSLVQFVLSLHRCKQYFLGTHKLAAHRNKQAARGIINSVELSYKHSWRPGRRDPWGLFTGESQRRPTERCFVRGAGLEEAFRCFSLIFAVYFSPLTLKTNDVGIFSFWIIWKK